MAERQPGGLRRAVERLPPLVAEPPGLPPKPPRWLMQGLAKLERDYFPQGGVRLTPSTIEAWRQGWRDATTEAKRIRPNAVRLTPEQRRVRDRIVDMAGEAFI